VSRDANEYIEPVIALAGRNADELKVRLDEGSKYLDEHRKEKDGIERMEALSLYKQLDLAYNKLLLMLEIGNLEV